MPGDPTFGALALAQGLLVIVLAGVARTLYRTDPDRRAAMRGLAGPAVAMLACALGGVMSGGVSQRMSDWLDGTGTPIPGPPVLLTWQASVIPPLLVLLLVLCGRLARRAWRPARAERAAVAREYPGETGDPGRTRRIATTRAMAALTDRAPRVVAVTSAATLLLGAGALAGALITDRTPGAATRGPYAAVHGAAETAQALGSWLIGLGFVLLVAYGRRAYKDASNAAHHRHPVGRGHLLAARRPPLRAALLRRARGARPDLADRHLDRGHRRTAGDLRPLPGQRPRRRRGLAACRRPPAGASRC
ncbi:hypothetical protein SGRIM128S_06708 [Streptomyces griseomycini]